MASPFPGMDPHLERPFIWTGVHAAVLAQFVEQLFRPLRPKYVVRFERRVFRLSPQDFDRQHVAPDTQLTEMLARRRSTRRAPAVAEPHEVPDLGGQDIRERSLHVYEVKGRSVVAVIELLSPTNKTPNSVGRESFIRKRREVYATDAHWMEIDLLRSGVRTADVPGAPPAEYQTFLSRVVTPADDDDTFRRRKEVVWPMPLRERLPIVAVPLRAGDPEVPLDLQLAVDAATYRGGYDLDFDYSQPPTIPLSPDDAEWAATLTDGFVAA